MPHRAVRARRLGRCPWPGRRGYSRPMGILRWFEKLLARTAAEPDPPRSLFGDADERDRSERAAAAEFELEVEKGKGRPRGF
jgi:hypothetical protein